jgi:hypothetical protein
METVELASVTTDRIEQALLRGEATVARIRATQMRLLTEIDRRQVPMGDGARSLQEWAAARMDLAPETALRLIQAARRLEDQPVLVNQLEEGHVSFDRAAEESRLAAAGADQSLVDSSRGWDIGGLRRVVARHQRMSRSDEQRVFDGRFLSIQPALDESSYRMWGLLPGADGRLVEQAIRQRAEQFPPLRDGKTCARNQRQADALVAIAQDSLDGTTDAATTSVPLVSIFLDAGLATRTNGESGTEIAGGPRVGPLTLEQVLCEGRVEVLETGHWGRPLAVGPTARTIPPKLRRFILHRDGGICTIDGCRSRYRLQPHHIKPRSQGGSHDPDNLTTLCWFHHHVAIHRNGHQIDPTSPPQRRRFLKPHKRGPP